ncbi:MAG: WD40/YVTN/BNR-like repeat-containing protein [Myxococcota bacterium]
MTCCRSWRTLAFGVAVWSVGSVAHANGRFPNAQQLREVGPTLVVAGTYGVLISGNAGTDFQFVCESVLFGKASEGSWIDPLLEALPDGTLISGSTNGLRISRNDACSFETAFTLPHDASFVGDGPAPNAAFGAVIDVCPAHDGATSLLALGTLRASDGSTIEHRLYKSGDSGRTWTALPNSIEKSALRTTLTVDVAPSRPARIYVSGMNSGVSTLAVSDDAGTSFTTHPIVLDDAEGVTGAYIAAVSAQDPDRVYVRVSRRSQADDGSETWDDSLLVSDDAGVHFRDVLRRRGALLGFALSPDDTSVLAGFGDPMVPPVVTSDDELGLYAASTNDLVFTQRVPELAVSCLHWTTSGLYACAKESDPLGTATNDFHIGVFKGSGVPQSKGDFQALLKLRDVRGPLPWASGSKSPCEAEWIGSDPNNPTRQGACATLNACSRMASLSPGAIKCGVSAPGSGGANAQAGAPARGGTVGAGGTAANAGGATVNAGTAGSSTHAGGTSPASGGNANMSRGGNASAGSAIAGDTSSTNSNHSSGCSCRIASDARKRTGLLSALAAALCSTRLRRKNPRKSER